MSDAFVVQPGAGRLLDMGTYVARGRPTRSGSSPPGRQEAQHLLAGREVGFLEELAAAEAAGTAAPDLVDAIAARHRMDILGAVPDSYLRRNDAG